MSIPKLYQTRKLRRKNFLPTLVITILLWLSIVGIVLFVDPRGNFVVPVFLLLVFLALLFTFSILFINTKRGVLGACVLTVFLILQILGAGNWLNFAIVIALAVIIDRLTQR